MKFRAFNNSPSPTLASLVSLSPSVQVVVTGQSYIQHIHEKFIKTLRTWQCAVMLKVVSAISGPNKNYHIHLIFPNDPLAALSINRLPKKHVSVGSLGFEMFKAD